MTSSGGPLDLASPESGDDTLGSRIDIRAEIAFPEPNDRPALVPKLSCQHLVPLTIVRNLGNPVGGIRAPLELPAEARPTPTVPEVAVTEDSDSQAGNHQVGSSSQFAGAEAVANSTGPESTP